MGLPKQGAYSYLNHIGWMLDIRTYGIGLLDEAIKLDLGLGHVGRLLLTYDVARLTRVTWDVINNGCLPVSLSF